jgi:hypothetical protein
MSYVYQIMTAKISRLQHPITRQGKSEIGVEHNKAELITSPHYV